MNEGGSIDISVTVPVEVANVLGPVMEVFGEILLLAVTPWTVGAVLLSWAIVQWVKLVIEAVWPQIPRDPPIWRLLVRTVSGAVGFAAGLGFAVGMLYFVGEQDKHWAVFVGWAVMVGASNGALWALAVYLSPRPIKKALTTPTDRKLMGVDADES